MDNYEREIADAYSKGKLELKDPDDELLNQLADAGRQTFKKDKRINIRLSSHDLFGIQQVAARKGIPYQAFISGLIHQYLEGDLVEEPQAKYGRKKR